GTCGIRDRVRCAGLDRTPPERITGPTPPPCLSGSDCGDLRCGSGVFAAPADHRRFGAAAPDRSRDCRSGIRTVVAATLGFRIDLLLGPGAEPTGVDLSGA